MICDGRGGLVLWINIQISMASNVASNNDAVSILETAYLHLSTGIR
jgi:hypothetical protein